MQQPTETVEVVTTATPEELERLVLSCIATPEDVAYAQNAGIDREAFQVDEHQNTWTYIVDFTTKHGYVPSDGDLRTVGFEVMEDVHDLRRYVEPLARDARARRNKAAIFRNLKNLEDDPDGTVATLIRDLQQNTTSRKASSAYFDRGAPERYEEVVRRTELHMQGIPLGIPTGFPVFDEAGGEWQRGEMIAVLGMPGSGKSTMIIHFAVVGWAAGSRVLFISPENKYRDIHLRADPMAAHFQGIQLSNHALRTGRGVDLQEYERYTQGIHERSDWLTVDSGLTGPFTIQDIERETAAFRPDILCVDGVHLLTGQGKTWEIIYEAGKVLKGLAQARDMVVLVACQADRSSWQDGSENPEMGQMAYGKAIGEDSNRVISMAKDRGGLNRRTFKVPKWRDGPAIDRKVYVAFDVDAGVIKQQSQAVAGDGTVDVSFD